MNVGLRAIIKMPTPYFLDTLLCTMYKSQVKVNADEVFYCTERHLTQNCISTQSIHLYYDYNTVFLSITASKIYILGIVPVQVRFNTVMF